jgi:uncharacterized lipoprotein NlpE involved in copper resistance
LGVFDAAGTMIVGRPSGSTDSIGIWGTDVRLARDAANTLALRNGTNAQTFRVYNTTDGTNSEFGAVKWSSNVLQIGTDKTGTGTVRSMEIDSAYQLALYARSGAGMYFSTNGTFRWYFDGAAGHLLAYADNTYDIGASGATRPRNLFLGSYAQLSEMTAPAAPAANGVRIYAVDNGSGKTQLMALFATGAAQQIAIEPP